MATYILNINCPDQKGIIATVTNFIHQKSGNIVYIDQYVDRENKLFFMRLECEFMNGNFTKEQFSAALDESIAKQYALEYDLYDKDYRPKMALFVSKYDHCLYDILARHQSKELAVDIPFILSNHKDLGSIAERFDIPFYHIPVTKDTKEEAEKRQLELLKQHKVECIVLARYMQIISPKLIGEYANKIINIHHSFLPAFPGAKPYHSAFERGVKIIGATSHYVTEELDAGPIIDQNTTQVSHLHSIEDFIAKGRDLERIVLSKAIQLHVNRKVLVYQNKTVIFS
ncbi:formyltetrahydrofolate deformylase [Flavobacteriaceae bacterium]|nr:formyltetrahydrofolate deformylase [Flavobacteriaceae bacterium]MDA9244944.1 formyltetrahydrofolate deformylase [Flavobacteriaceae bacterium]MDA9984274.1 formyltetrahydrofolate deformylase [Flavobacteriaceae bacterium]MDB4118077.1 formyltetrahydrofolate deformylase [Flavobacteriaceae bacterium]MDB4186668.1 formyltetrahydrofolate deformylase [Flavobacteriaceae bacterium]